MERAKNQVAGTRWGFTLMELLLVVVIIGILAALTAPRISTALNQRSVRGATDGFESLFRRARATAISSRLPATITFASSVASVSIVRAGSTVTVGQNLDFPAQYGVAVTASGVTLQIEPTGLVLNGTPFTVIATKGGAADTTRVTGYGRIE